MSREELDEALEALNLEYFVEAHKDMDAEALENGHESEDYTD